MFDVNVRSVAIYKNLTSRTKKRKKSFDLFCHRNH